MPPRRSSAAARAPAPTRVHDRVGAPTRTPQVDVTSKTEGKALADNAGVPLLVKYDARLRENVARNIVDDVTMAVEKAEGVEQVGFVSR
jgi:hypothetical protein